MPKTNTSVQNIHTHRKCHSSDVSCSASGTVPALSHGMRSFIPFLLVLNSCGTSAPVADEAQQYMDDSEYRRTVIESSLWLPELPYSQSLLSNYSLGNMGWDLLPLMNTPLNDVPMPETTDEWLALGKRVFYELPMRRDGYLTWVAQSPELWTKVGLEPNEDGKITGLVTSKSLNGNIHHAVSCAFCHTHKGVEGRGNPEVNLGEARALFAEAVGNEDTVGRTWGKGRIDVTDDGVNGPTRIPNLWGVKYASHLNHAGVIEVSSPATLAMRFETQYILGHRMESRPARQLTWALAQYVLSLRAPAPRGVATKADTAAFTKHCSSCHNPDNGYAGGLVPAQALNSDDTVAHTPDRGTGYYKVPSLRGVSNAGPFLHNGRFETLRELMASGHPAGVVLDSNTQEKLVNFLNSL